MIVDRKLKLGNGKIVEGKLEGDKGGDVWVIKIKANGKYIDAQAYKKKVGGKVFPIKSTTKTPFCDIDVVKKTKCKMRKAKIKKKVKKAVKKTRSMWGLV